MHGKPPSPGSITASVTIDTSGKSTYASESGNRAVVTPICSKYPLTYKPESIYGETPKFWLLVGIPPEACEVGSIIHTEHVNGSGSATIDWQVVDPVSVERRLQRWVVVS